jgi:hypothetical protein
MFDESRKSALEYMDLAKEYKQTLKKLLTLKAKALKIGVEDYFDKLVIQFGSDYWQVVAIELASRYVLEEEWEAAEREISRIAVLSRERLEEEWVKHRLLHSKEYADDRLAKTTSISLNMKSEIGEVCPLLHDMRFRKPKEPRNPDFPADKIEELLKKYKILKDMQIIH